MVICNHFEIKLNVTDSENPIVGYHIHTDLPAGTQVILSCRRTYRDKHGEDSLWVGKSGRLKLTPADKQGYCGCRGEIDIVGSDKLAFELFNQINSSSYSPPGITTPVSDEMTLDFVVGGRQLLRQFGPDNAKLTGNLVSDRGGIQVVEVSRKIHIPMKSELQPILGLS